MSTENRLESRTLGLFLIKYLLIRLLNKKYNNNNNLPVNGEAQIIKKCSIETFKNEERYGAYDRRIIL